MAPACACVPASLCPEHRAELVAQIVRERLACGHTAIRHARYVEAWRQSAEANAADDRAAGDHERAAERLRLAAAIALAPCPHREASRWLAEREIAR